MAVGIGPASRFGPAWMQRWGAGALLATGMLLMAGCYATFAAMADGDQPLWIFAVVLAVFGLGFGMSITPGTSLIIDGLPPDRRTLSAAVNDVTREVGGALGGAVAASVLVAIYSDRLAPALRPLPDDAAANAEDGLTQALELAARLGPQGQTLAEAALTSFSDGYAVALWVAAAVVAAAGLACGAMAPRMSTARHEEE